MKESLKLIGMGIGGLLLFVVLGVRGCGLQEGTPPTERTFVFIENQRDARQEAKRMNRQTEELCDGQWGVLGDILGIEGPAAVRFKVTNLANGKTRTAVIRCSDGMLLD